jgi:hypothetical protein
MFLLSDYAKRNHVLNQLIKAAGAEVAEASRSFAVAVMI